jgi:pilus assembly protein CpaC
MGYYKDRLAGTVFCTVMLLAGIAAPAQTAIEHGLLTPAGAPQVKINAPVLPKPVTTQAQATPAPAPQAAPATPAPASPPQAQAPEQVTPTGAEPLRVMVAKSLLIKTADRIRRVSVTDPEIADAVVVTPYQVLIHGRSAGEVSLIMWNDEEQSQIFDLRVEIDLTGVSEEMSRALPGDSIQVSASRNALVLTGHAATKEDADRAGAIAAAFSKTVVNALTFGPVGADEVMLEVKFAEVDRTQLLQYGFNLFSTGATNTFGAVSTQQFGNFSGANVGAVTNDVQLGGTPNGAAVATGEINGPLFHQPGSFGTNDLLNLFLFRTDINLGAIVRALQQKNVLQILAEPNLIAVNGKEASFLAGGEFPYPVPQGIAGAITIQFKEFGVRLSFTPLIMANGTIHMVVKPEVSSLDFSNALTTNGFVIPALSTRRAQTEFELQDGQSFVIAGLMDNRVTDIASKIPGLGDIPILGQFFKSKNSNKSATELMVLVTAHRISPLTVPPAGPVFPEKFMGAAQPPAQPQDTQQTQRP